MKKRAFDLNIEKVLENWEVEHAIREVIANALDEQALSKTAEIEIAKDKKGDWHIQDFGRGLKIEDFTLNENKEKLNAPPNIGVIGKFGVGLKDALATFHRRGIGVLVLSLARIASNKNTSTASTKLSLCTSSTTKPAIICVGQSLFCAVSRMQIWLRPSYSS